MGRDDFRAGDIWQSLGFVAPRAGNCPAVEHVVVLRSLDRLWWRSHLHSSLVALFLLQHSVRIATVAGDCLWTRAAHLLRLGVDRPKNDSQAALDSSLDDGAWFIFHCL